MKLNLSKKILIVSIIVFIIILVLDGLFTNLLIGKIYNINNNITQLNLSSQERERELNLKDSVLGSKLEREKLLSYFVGAGNLETLDFTKYLEDLARASGLTQKKTLVTEPLRSMESSSVVSTIRYRLDVSGSWSSIYNFLQTIENMSKVVILNSVSIRKDSDSKIWSADLDFSVVNLKK
jgi:hypothetical protein